MKDQDNQNNYNDEPVFYCKHCLSLKIMNESKMFDLEYCGDCGSTNIDQTHISNWEEIYRQRYGFKLLDKQY